MNNPDHYQTDTYELTFAFAPQPKELIVTKRWLGGEAHRGLCRVELTDEETQALLSFTAEHITNTAPLTDDSL